MLPGTRTHEWSTGLVEDTVKLTQTVVLFGISFEMPVVMVTLTKFGVVEARVWVENWRYGILASFIIALLLSPGVTGGSH